MRGWVVHRLTKHAHGHGRIIGLGLGFQVGVATTRPWVA